MINDELNDCTNMGRREIFKELPLPSKVEEKGILNLIYKGIFIIVKLLLDIRLNLVKISSGEKIKTIGNSPRKTYNKNFKRRDQKPVENPIRGLDKIIVTPDPANDDVTPTVENKPVIKKVDIKLTEGSTKTNTKEPKNNPPPIQPPDGETKDNVDPTIDL